MIKMWSPKGDCQLALTSGHTFVVPGDPEGAELPTVRQRDFHLEAVRRGCLPVGATPPEEEQDTTAKRSDIIKKKMVDMINSSDPDYFMADGRPNAKKLSKLCGFNVETKERDVLWQQVEQDMDRTETV